MKESMFEASEALQKMEGMKKIKLMSFHQYSSNSEVEATWASLIGWPHKTSNIYIKLLICFSCQVSIIHYIGLPHYRNLLLWDPFIFWLDLQTVQNLKKGSQLLTRAFPITFFILIWVYRWIRFFKKSS